ncbi:hypothetical protein QAD02_009912 [Eretmocerus hayati]|uniref:Uncharacterized protein n=1 Tax=Eretmocerus hayati TaxID=131215 RepID=A0ACC2NB20_9HYME|nr:hypothetical protein QAD02_009912 [Eretmocerus hayati]
MDEQHVEMNAHRSEYNDSLTTDLQNYFERFRKLVSAVRQGQIKTVELLLKEGAPVNRHPDVPRMCHYLKTPLYSSVQSGNPRIVKMLLHKGADVNSLYMGDTPLTLAVKCEKYEIVDLLMTTKGLKNCSSEEGITHFHIACMRNQVNVARTLIEDKRNINSVIKVDSDYWPGFTPLHLAVQFQCVETVQFLLSVGADITLKDVRQCTPLHLAHLLRNEQIIDIILLNHSKVVSNPVNSKGLSHFHIACSRNNPGIVQHFINFGLSLYHPVFQMSSYRYDRQTPIDIAIQYECIDVVRLLLQSGNQVGYPDVETFRRVENAYGTGNMEIVNLLTAIDRLSKITLKNRWRINEPLQQNYRDTERVQSLLNRTSNALNLPIYSSGCTHLHAAIQHNSKEIARLLLDRRADFTIQDFQGKSPLHLAFEREMDDLVNFMLENHKYYDKNPVDDDGLSHLHIACAKNHVNAIEHLLKIGVNLNSPVNFDSLSWPGFTPLHFTAEFGACEATEILLKHGAGYSATDALNFNAFATAFIKHDRSHANDQVIEVMKSILRHHSHIEDENFNDQGISILHLLCIAYLSPDPPIEDFISALDAHPDEINKAIHNMDSSWDGYTPLHCAAYRRIEDRVRLLIERGADVLKKAKNGDTPLHLWTVSMIANYPPDSRLLYFNYMGRSGYSIFHQACEDCDLELMKYFLENGVDPNHRGFNKYFGYEDRPPIKLVLLTERNLDNDSTEKAVKLLLQYGADPNLGDCQRNTSLHSMNYDPQSKIIDVLISNGADVNAQNVFFETPLFSMCCHPCIDPEPMGNHVESFLRNGADINLADERGLTPLTVEYWDEVEPDQYAEIATVVEKLLMHVMKLKTVGFYVCEMNESGYSSLLELFSGDLHFDQEIFVTKCKVELELMKQTKIDRYTTLFDILFQNLNELAVTSQNQAFQQLLASEDFVEKFPIYGFMLKLRLKQGEIRWPLLNESSERLEFLFGISLPRSCAEKILEHLNNKNLENVIMSIQ